MVQVQVESVGRSSIHQKVMLCGAVMATLVLYSGFLVLVYPMLHAALRFYVIGNGYECFVCRGERVGNESHGTWSSTCAQDQKWNSTNSTAKLCHENHGGCFTRYQTKAVFGEEIGAVIERGCADDNLQMNIPLDDGTNRTLEVVGVANGRYFLHPENQSISYKAWQHWCSTFYCNSLEDYEHRWGFADWIQDVYRIFLFPASANYTIVALSRTT